jgi:hypothetical protein
MSENVLLELSRMANMYRQRNHIPALYVLLSMDMLDNFSEQLVQLTLTTSEEAKSAIIAGEAYLLGMKVLVIANTFGMLEVV